jgi:hypothetical protein
MNAGSSELLSTVAGTGGANAKIRNEKKSETIISGTQAIPHVIGPNGVIQIWPDQVARKMTREKSTNPLSGLLENIEKNTVMTTVIINAAITE